MSGKTTDEIKAAVVNHYVNQGFTVKGTDPLNLVFEKPHGINTTVQVLDALAGVPPGGGSWHRIKVLILKQPDGTHRLVGEHFGVANRGANEREFIRRERFRELQSALDQIKASLERK